MPRPGNGSLDWPGRAYQPEKRRAAFSTIARARSRKRAALLAYLLGVGTGAAFEALSGPLGDVGVADCAAHALILSEP